MTARYDRIGHGYHRNRREDPRFAERIHAALGSARSVLNVGAGAGSYEPEDRDVIAVEPSQVFLGTEQRINTRGRARLEFRHDIAEHGFSYGFDYNYPFHGGFYDIDIVTITRNDPARRLNAFVQNVWFDDWTFRLESNNTLDASRCRTRQRFDGTTIDGMLELTQESCSSRYRRLILTIQTTF